MVASSQVKEEDVEEAEGKDNDEEDGEGQLEGEEDGEGEGESQGGPIEQYVHIECGGDKKGHGDKEGMDTTATTVTEMTIIK